MTTRKTYSLGAHWDSFVEAQVSSGQYGNQSEVIRAGLRMLELHHAKLAALRADVAAADAEIAAGKGIEVSDAKSFAADIVKRGQKRSKARP